MYPAIPAEPTRATIPAMHYDRPTPRHDAAYSPSAPGDDRQCQSDADGADPFAPLTDAKKRMNVVPNGGDKQAGDYNNLTMLPCPDELPAVSHFRFGDLSEPSSIWVYKNVAGDAVFADGSLRPSTQMARETRTYGPGLTGDAVWTDRKWRNPQDRHGLALHGAALAAPDLWPGPSSSAPGYTCTSGRRRESR